MTVYGLPSQEMQMLCNGPVVRIPLFDIGVAGGKMGGDEAEACIVVVQSDTHSPLIS